MRFDPSNKEVIAIVKEVMASNAGFDIVGCGFDVFDGFFGGDVFHDDF